MIGYGTFPFAQEIQLHRRWFPGAWCDSNNLDCAVYFAHFGEYLLNQPYAIMPGVEAIRMQDWLFSALGIDDEVFCRPTGCHKLFTGRCIYKEDFTAGLALTRYDPSTLVVVPPPKQIPREWRLVAAGDRIIAASQYAIDGLKSISPSCPEEVRAFAEGMLAEVRWRPDPIFLLDIGEAEGKLWLIELNGFSTSWLYQCDLAIVVAKASEAARREWEKGRDTCHS